MTVTWTLSDRHCLAISLQNDVRHQLVTRAKHENRLTDTQVTAGSEREITSIRAAGTRNRRDLRHKAFRADRETDGHDHCQISRRPELADG